MRRPIRCWLPIISALALVFGAAACSDDATPGTASGSAQDAGSAHGSSCPGEVLDVVVTIGQWTDLVENLAGACANVTTVVSGDAGDPHDFEPSPSDRVAFDGADLVVMNGAGFDRWAEDALESSGASPAVVDAAAVAGAQDGDNPHLWYSPVVVGEVGDAVTAELTAQVPDAATYFTDRARDWDVLLMPYTDLVERLGGEVTGRPYAATESVFDLMAEALHLINVTPPGFRQAVANESEPSPGDLAAMTTVLEDGSAAVLVFNTQTESALTSQLRDVAERTGVPVVEVTETQPDGVSFVEWQVAQLAALEVALRVPA